MPKEPCLCAAPDCRICGPMQGYRQARRSPYGRLSAEDIDILNAECEDDENDEDEDL